MSAPKQEFTPEAGSSLIQALEVNPTIASLISQTRRRIQAEPTSLLSHFRILDRQLLQNDVTETVSVGANEVLIGSVHSLKTRPLRSCLARAGTHGIEGLVSLYQQAEGRELAALNVLCANQCLPVDSLWLHFLNKYLSHQNPELPRQDNRFSIHLGRGSESRFQRLQAASALPNIAKGPLVSVLMPVFNAQATLAVAVSSILGQTWQNWELLLVDDASTDESLERCQQWSLKDPRIRVISLRRNGGPYVAKNVGLSLVHGDFLTVHDADDWAFPTRLEDQLQPLLEGQELKHVSVGASLRMTTEGRITRFDQPLEIDGALRWCHPSPLFRRSFFQERLGAWDSVRFGADTEILERMLRFAPEKIAMLPTPVMLQLDQEGSLTRQGDSFIGPQGASPKRVAYRQSWKDWHQQQVQLPRLVVPQRMRSFAVPNGMQTHALGVEDLIDVRQSRRL